MKLLANDIERVHRKGSMNQLTDAFSLMYKRDSQIRKIPTHGMHRNSYRLKMNLINIGISKVSMVNFIIDIMIRCQIQFAKTTFNGNMWFLKKRD